MATIPSISFGLYDQDIRSDSTPTCPDEQAFSNLDNLVTGNVVKQAYATLEPNFWMLNGKYSFLEDGTVNLGYVSLSQSDGSGDFAAPIVITIEFGSDHDTDGLTIVFFRPGNDYAADMQVQYYDSGDVLLEDNTYYPDSYEFSVTQAVTGFRKIVLTFTSTNHPNRFLRIRAIEHGLLVKFSGADIKSAVVVEEINAIATTLPFGTAEASIHSDDAAFSIVNPSGNYANLSERQPLDFYVVIEGEDVYLGRYFLDTWENPSENEITFRCIDELGLLDKLPCMGGLWLTPITAADLLSDLLDAVDVPYSLDTTLEDIEVTGWIPAGTYREALQQIAMAIGAYVTCSRLGILQIKESVLAVDQTGFRYFITDEDKGAANQSLTLKPLVTGVVITGHDYLENTDVKELYNGILAAGTYTIIFDQPAHDLEVTGGSITESGANYANVSVAAPGIVSLTGEGYTDTTRLFSQYIPDLGSNVKQNVISIKDATLINSVNGANAIDRIYNYYQQRYLQRVRLYANPLELGKSILLDAISDSQISCVGEKATIDIARGCISDMQMTGVLHAV